MTTARHDYWDIILTLTKLTSIHPPANAGDSRDTGSIPGQEDSLEKGMATCFSILACKIQQTEEPGGVQSKGSQRVWHDWAHMYLFYWYNRLGRTVEIARTVECPQREKSALNSSIRKRYNRRGNHKREHFSDQNFPDWSFHSLTEEAEMSEERDRSKSLL